MSQRNTEDCFASFSRAIAEAATAIKALNLDDESAVLEIVGMIHDEAKTDFQATGNCKTTFAS